MEEIVLGGLTVVAVVVGLLVVGVFAYNAWTGVYREENPLRPPAESNYHFVDLPQGRTAYKLRGPGEGKLVVLVHGFSSYSYVNDPLAEGLVKKGYQVLQMDLYGRGYSATPRATRYDARFYCDQIALLLYKLDATRNKTFTLFGASMSGAVVTMFAYLFPEKVERLVLYAPAGFPMYLPPIARLARVPVVGEILMTLGGRSSLVDHVDEGFTKPIKKHVEPILKREREAILMQWDGNPAYKRALAQTLCDFEFQRMSEIYKKVGERRHFGKHITLLWGTHDTTVPFALHKLVREAMPECHFIPLQDLAHDITENEEEITAILVKAIHVT